MLAAFTLLLGAGPALAHPAVTAGPAVTLAVAATPDTVRSAWSPLLPPPVARAESPSAALLGLDRLPPAELVAGEREPRKDRKRRWMLLGGAAAVSAGGVLFMLNRPAAPGLEPVRLGVRWNIRGATAALVGRF